LAQIDGVAIDPTTVETNIVRFRLTNASAAAFVEAAHRRGLWMLPSGPDAVRAVFYLDIGVEDAERALAITAETLRELPKPDSPAAAAAPSSSARGAGY
jgi:threonine aldolase